MVNLLYKVHGGRGCKRKGGSLKKGDETFYHLKNEKIIQRKLN